MRKPSWNLWIFQLTKRPRRGTGQTSSAWVDILQFIQMFESEALEEARAAAPTCAVLVKKWFTTGDSKSSEIIGAQWGKSHQQCAALGSWEPTLCQRKRAFAENSLKLIDYFPFWRVQQTFCNFPLSLFPCYIIVKFTFQSGNSTRKCMNTFSSIFWVWFFWIVLPSLSPWLMKVS